MAGQPIIWRRNRAAVKAKQDAIKAANEAYRQQFIDAAAADAEKAAQPAPTQRAEQKAQQQAPQPTASKHQQNQRR